MRQKAPARARYLDSKATGDARAETRCAVQNSGTMTVSCSVARSFSRRMHRDERKPWCRIVRALETTPNEQVPDRRIDVSAITVVPSPFRVPPDVRELARGAKHFD
jgi:hypothetical protein